MTLRRYAPLALAALAVACKPDIEQRTNATTTEYALFNPAASQIPLPNDIALQKFLASDPGPAVLPCSYFLPNTTTTGLCAFARAGGFPAAAAMSSIQITFLTGTLGGDGIVDYLPSAFDVGSLAFAGLAPTPNAAVIDVTNPLAPAMVAVTPAFTAATGVLTLAPAAGSWTVGHKYVALVRGYADGVLTDAAATYVAMPTLYILREAVLGDLDLSLPENQGLFPGDAAEKAAAGTQLEPLRVGYQGILQLTQGLALAGVNLPFADLISMQSFQIGPSGTVALGEGTDPADASITTGQTAPLDAFTVQSSVATATLVAVAVELTDANTAVASLSVNASAGCGAATTLGTLSTSAGGTGTKVIVLSTFASATLTAATPLWVCATASSAIGTVTGNVLQVTPFTGTAYTSTDGDAAGATLTVN